MSIFHRRSRSEVTTHKRRTTSEHLQTFLASVMFSHAQSEPASASSTPRTFVAPAPVLLAQLTRPAPTFAFPPTNNNSPETSQEGEEDGQRHDGRELGAEAEQAGGQASGAEEDDTDEDDEMDDDESDRASIADSLFSSASARVDPVSIAAHGLIHELERNLASLTEINSTIRLRCTLLRALVRRLARELRITRFELAHVKADRASGSDSTPTHVYSVHSHTNTIRQGLGRSQTHSMHRSQDDPSPVSMLTNGTSGDHYHLIDVMDAFPLHQDPQKMNRDPSHHNSLAGPTSPSDAYFDVPSRSSSDTHPNTPYTADLRSISSFPPPTPSQSAHSHSYHSGHGHGRGPVQIHTSQQPGFGLFSTLEFTDATSVSTGPSLPAPDPKRFDRLIEDSASGSGLSARSGRSGHSARSPRSSARSSPVLDIRLGPVLHQAPAAPSFGRLRSATEDRPRPSLQVPRSNLGKEQKEHKRSSRHTVLSFLPSRSFSTKSPPQNRLIKPEPSKPRPSLQINTSTTKSVKSTKNSTSTGSHKPIPAPLRSITTPAPSSASAAGGLVSVSPGMSRSPTSPRIPLSSTASHSVGSSAKSKTNAQKSPPSSVRTSAATTALVVSTSKAATTLAAPTSTPTPILSSAPAAIASSTPAADPASGGDPKSTRIPTLTNIRSSAKKLRDTIYRRSRLSSNPLEPRSSMTGTAVTSAH